MKHNFELTKGKDKLIIVRDILERSRTKMKKTLVFCNTIDSCRAAEYGINDGSNLQAISYHGDMNSRERSENLEKFKSGNVLFLFIWTHVDYDVNFSFLLQARKVFWFALILLLEDWILLMWTMSLCSISL